MTNVEQITNAVGMHGMWKRRLMRAIESGQTNTIPEHVESDDLCDFGKWLHGLPPAERNAEHWKNVQRLHAAFHKEAANVLRLALSGQKAEAEKCMAIGGSFSRVSADLTRAMMAWKQAGGN